jgi:hypothetical protein
MSNLPDWLPDLLLFEDFGGDWQRYEDEIFTIFYKDFIENQPKFQDKWVRCRRDLIKGKEAAFWHCTSEGPDENNRTPDIKRCERIRWIKTIIEHSDSPEVDCWSVRRRGETRWLIWFNEEFLIVLGERQRTRDGFKYMQLITVYCTEEKRRKEKLRKERDEFNKAKNG